MLFPVFSCTHHRYLSRLPVGGTPHAAAHCGCLHDLSVIPPAVAPTSHVASSRHLRYIVFGCLGLSVRVLEASDDIGGRVRTDIVDGFQLDRGFQIFLTGYPTAREELDFDALDLKPFYSGAMVRFEGALHRCAPLPRSPPRCRCRIISRQIPRWTNGTYDISGRNIGHVDQPSTAMRTTHSPVDCFVTFQSTVA